MSLNYANIFGDLGVLIARLNSYQTLGGTTLPADLLTLLTQFGTRWLPEEGIAHYYGSVQDNVTSWRQTLTQYTDQRVTDSATVTDILGLTQPDLATTLAALTQQMLADSQSVKACTVSVGAVTPKSSPANHGNGLALPTLVLDGYNSPLVNGVANVNYNGWLTQLAVPSETMTLTCVADSAQDGLSEGSEHFSWSGGTKYSEQDYRSEGSGPGPDVQVSNGQSLLSGADIESFSGGVPSGWTLDSGLVGNLAQDSVIYFRGASSCQLLGGSPVLQLGQAVNPSSLQGKRRYHFSVAVRTQGTAPTTSSLVLKFTSQISGYDPEGNEQITVTGDRFPGGTWTIYSGWINMPNVIPSDWRFVVQLNNAPVGVTVWVDSLTLAPVTYHGGVGVNIVSGNSPWLKGDRLTFPVTNDGAGLFQSYARRHWQIQWPSVLTGSRSCVEGMMLALRIEGNVTVTESILDSWVA